MLALAELQARRVLVWEELERQQPLCTTLGGTRPLVRVLPGDRTD
jgi:hypothetical protein